jgi:hypothetical protein
LWWRVARVVAAILEAAAVRVVLELEQDYL